MVHFWPGSSVCWDDKSKSACIILSISCMHGLSLTFSVTSQQDYLACLFTSPPAFSLVYIDYSSRLMLSKTELASWTTGREFWLVLVCFKAFGQGTFGMLRENAVKPSYRQGCFFFRYYLVTSGFFLYAYVEMYQVRRLVFDTYQ